MEKTVEFKVCEVTRYILTRFESQRIVNPSGTESGGAGSSQIGEFVNLETAEMVGNALHDFEPGSTFSSIHSAR